MNDENVSFYHIAGLIIIVVAMLCGTLLTAQYMSLPTSTVIRFSTNG